MAGYIHGKTTTVISVAELQRLKANQRAKPLRPKSAPQIEATILQAPGAQRRHWDKARMQDAQIKRCGVSSGASVDGSMRSVIASPRSTGQGP